MRAGSPLPAVTAASIVAGPLFLTSAAVASLYLELPKTIVVGPEQFTWFLLTLVPSLLFAFLPAFVLNLIGSSLMIGLTGMGRSALPPEAWLAAGAAIGSGVAASFGAGPEIAFALVATSALCAWICRKGAAAD